MARRAPLRCWLGGLHVADLEPKKPWDLRCRYTADALDRWDIGVPLLSCALPVGTRPLRAASFVRGLLPEGRHLQAVASLARIPTNDHHGLLARFGRDIAGAVVITVDDEPPAHAGVVEDYSDDALAAEVASLDESSLGLHADSELSIAGIQNKLLLVELPDGRWGRPVHGYPSTHILKIDDDRYPGLVRAEAACLSLAYDVGLTHAPPRFEIIGGRECVIVARYDRRSVRGRIMRVHQEDACQALDVDIDAHRGRGKYEAFGGPTLAQIAELLRIHAHMPTIELERLVGLVTFSAAIGNADLHGKNISFLHDDGAYLSLAPAYDTVPTMLWPKLRATSAVSINGETDFASISIDAIMMEAAGWGMDESRARAAAADMVTAIATALPDAIERGDLATAIEHRLERLAR
jgi:serine/threonine-protein kinase HipA